MKIEYILELIEEHAVAAVRGENWRELEVMKEIKKAIELYSGVSALRHDEMRRMTDEQDGLRAEQEAIWGAIGKGVLRQARLVVAQDDFECLQAEWRREHKLIMDTRPVE